MATGRWTEWASCGALAVWLLAGCGGHLAQTPQSAPVPVAKAAEITDIQVAGAGDAVQITVAASVPAAYSLVQQSNPPRLHLELARTKGLAQERIIPVNRGVVTLVKPVTAGPNGGIEVLLSAEAAYDIAAHGTNIVLNVTPKAPAAALVPAGTPAANVGESKPVEAPPAAATAPAASAAAAALAPAPAEPPPAPAPAPAAPVPAGPRMLTGIDVQKQADGLVVVLQGNGPLSYEYFLVQTKSLVVDIAGAGNKVWPLKKKVDDAWVSQIRLGEHTQPKKATRVVFDLKQLAEYRVEGVGDRILVSFGAAALASPAAPAAATPAAGGAANTVGEVTYRPLGAGSRLEIRTAAKADFTVVDAGDPAKVVVEITNAEIAEKDRKTLDLSPLNLEVVKVSAFPWAKGDGRAVRVVAQLRQPVPFRAIAEGERVLVDFEKAPAPPAAVVAAAAPAPVDAPAPPPPADAPAAPAYTGRRLSLDFKDADVNDILRLISEVSEMNFVAGPEVKGTVTIKLADVPWDQALDIILKSNQPPLAQIREAENIMRITTIDKILDEEQRRRRIEEDRQKTIDAQAALEPLFTKSYAISYAKAQDIRDFVEKSFSSERGRNLIQFDERTNLLIVQDTAANIAEIDRVIQSLDTPTPAVLVEARIVEVDNAFGQSIGVQWNAIGVRDTAHGNATNWAFPNSISFGGAANPGPAGAGNMMVNVPATSATAGIGFSFGHIANTLSLDLRISAGEKMGKIKILSNPKVLVVQNQKATINLGNQLPIPKTDAEGNRTVEWKDVGIMLEVQPQVTNDKRVFMDIKIEKSSQGENVQTTEGTMFSIKTSRADTKVLIGDGETTVIGGIFIQESIDGQEGVPGLSNLPLFGWLFKSKTAADNKRELMIFLTPRLVVL